ncbi:MAG: DUF2147 domain-containing protein [Cytophagales bacterium]|nr:DUF2147 domain-containing protein [Bernardetiaceae bacterium]MDW8210520.1 DUF2147 domain-containing protein [Cytophagales bacterium]
MKRIASLVGIFITAVCSAQDITGKWKTIDDQDGKPRSVVEIYKQGDKYFGRIVEIFYRPDETPDPVCTKCPDERKGTKVIGMVIIRNLQKQGDEYKGGDILDPKSGKIYDCKLWLENGTLKVRGYIAFLYRTQTWYRYP